MRFVPVTDWSDTFVARGTSITLQNVTSLVKHGLHIIDKNDPTRTGKQGQRRCKRIIKFRVTDNAQVAFASAMVDSRSLELPRQYRRNRSICAALQRPDLLPIPVAGIVLVEHIPFFVIVWIRQMRGAVGGMKCTIVMTLSKRDQLESPVVRSRLPDIPVIDLT